MVKLTTWGSSNWSPFKELEDVLNKYHHMGNWPTSKDNNNNELTVPDWSPKVDIKENKEAYTIKAELPGVDKKDINITLEDGVLTLRGEKHFEKEFDDEKTHRVECHYGSFVRSFSLPESVEDDCVKASFKDGMLNLVIPKATKAKQKSININVE